MKKTIVVLLGAVFAFAPLAQAGGEACAEACGAKATKVTKATSAGQCGKTKAANTAKATKKGAKGAQLLVML